MSTWNLLEGVTVAGRYELQEYLANGGMATVYRAWDHRLARPVAVKVLRQLEDADPFAVERFRREAHAAAALRSPYIVEVYDFLEEDGCHYLVMELVEGINFKREIVERGPLPAAHVVAVAIQVCRAIQAAHEHGFIHRDIKPQNVLLAPSERAKLTDFGIVHISQASSFTTTGIVLGTADYISPEQAQGFPLGPTTDIYSLGVVMYEALTGALPFTATTPIGVALLHATTTPAPLHLVNPSVPRELERIVMRALRKDAATRYASASEMEAALVTARATCSTQADLIPDEVPQDADEQSTDVEWRTLAELLRRQDAIHQPRAANAAASSHTVPAVEWASSTSSAPHPDIPVPHFGDALVAHAHPSAHSHQRLLAACVVAAMLVAALILLHLIT